jgi:hypothetical protein
METNLYADYILTKTNFVEHLQAWMKEFCNQRELMIEISFCLCGLSESASKMTVEQYTQILTPWTTYFVLYAKHLLSSHHGDIQTQSIVSRYMKFMTDMIVKCRRESQDEVAGYLNAIFAANQQFVARCLTVLIAQHDLLREHGVSRSASWYALSLLVQLSNLNDTTALELSLSSNSAFWDTICSFCFPCGGSDTKTWLSERHQKTESAQLACKLLRNCLHADPADPKFVEKIDKAAVLQKAMLMQLPVQLLLELVWAYVLNSSIPTASITLLCSDATFFNTLRRGLTSLSSDTMLEALDICCQLLNRNKKTYCEAFELYGMWLEIDKLQQFPESAINDTARFLMETYQDRDEFALTDDEDTEVQDQEENESKAMDSDAK